MGSWGRGWQAETCCLSLCQELNLPNSQLPDDTLSVSFSHATPSPQQNFPDSWRETYFFNLYFQWNQCAPIWHLQLRT